MKKYVIWDDHNDIPFVIVYSQSNRTCYGLFLMTSNPVEVQTIPKKSRIVFKILGNGIFSMFVYAGPTLKDVI